MRDKKTLARLTQAFVICAVLLVAGTPILAQETTLYTFSNAVDGSTPEAGLVSDSAGNLYGTTWSGGSNSYGVVYELSPAAGGGWIETVLHNFSNDGTDGARSISNLVFDSAGNLYGTTYTGGAFFYGTVFELSPTAGGLWTETVLHSFNNDGTDGFYPQSGLVLDASGNLYGVTPAGGKSSCGNSFGCGTVFELSPQTGGSWTETIIHNFGDVPDGAYPYGNLVFHAGNLFGTTSGGGSHFDGPGTVFELRPSGGDSWSEQILYNFNRTAKDGYQPIDGVTFDAKGNIYGATYEGGAGGVGTFFELTPSGGKYWRETILYNFESPGGRNPSGTPFLDANGSLYGTTSQGGAFLYGTAFKLTRGAGGAWTEKLIHSFGGPGDTRYPSGGLVPDSAGNLFGITSGAVFEITP